MTIHLPEELERSLRAAVEGGQFASLDEAMVVAATLLLARLEQQHVNGAAEADGSDAEAPQPIWEQFQELTADIPDEEWARLPTDLAEQHDHYLYGTPKRPPLP